VKSVRTLMELVNSITATRSEGVICVSMNFSAASCARTCIGHPQSTRNRRTLPAETLVVILHLPGGLRADDRVGRFGEVGLVERGWWIGRRRLHAELTAVRNTTIFWRLRVLQQAEIGFASDLRWPSHCFVLDGDIYDYQVGGG